MGYDLVTWSPAVGSSGDDKYNVPGATKIDGSVDTGSPRRVSVGTASFSATPTIAQINAAADINQVVALYNKRVDDYVAAFGTVPSGTTPTAQSYFSSDVRISASGISAFQTKINQLRVAEGFPSYTFPTVSSGTRISGAVLAHLRKSLAISDTLTLRFSGTFANGEFAVWKKDANSPFTETLNGRVNSLSDWVGYRSASSVERGRLMVSFRVPTWLTDTTKISTAELKFTVQATGVVGSPTLQAYISNTDDVPYSSVTQVLNTNNSMGTLSPVVGANTFTISSFGLLTAQAGGWVSTIFQTVQESAGLTTNAYAVFPAFTTAAPQIVINFT